VIALIKAIQFQKKTQDTFANFSLAVEIHHAYPVDTNSHYG
jgi:hypothetical protein